MGSMSPDLAFKSVDGADAEANRPRHLADAGALGQLQARTLEFLGLGIGTAKPRAHNPDLALELAVACELVLDDVQSCADPMAEHGALELSKGAGDLEQQ